MTRLNIYINQPCSKKQASLFMLQIFTICIVPYRSKEEKFDFLLTTNKKALENQGLKHSWSWGESNSRPNIFSKSFLHAYCYIICRNITGVAPTNDIRS